LIIGHTIRSEASDIDNQRRISEQIWALEERYITSYRSANFEDLKVIWHDKFLGWPADLKYPANKKAVIKYTKEKNSKYSSWDFKVERMGIQILGNTVINHYNLLISGMTTRVTHTWIKEGTQWRIFGGMSDRQ